MAFRTIDRGKFRVLEGLLSERPALPPDGQTAYWCRDVGAEQYCFPISDGTLTGFVWSTIPDSLEGSAGKYWVAPPGAGRVNAPYTTIAAAIAAAVADGHSSGTVPANIYVTPGLYAENITLFDGINVVGVGAQAVPSLSTPPPITASQRPQLFGTVALDAACTLSSIANMTIVHPGGTAIAIGALAGLIAFGLFGCNVVTSGAGGLCFSSAAAATPSITFDHCNLFNATTQAGTGGVKFSSAHTVDVLDTSILCNVGTDESIRFDAACTFRAQRMRTVGLFRMSAGASTCSFEDCDHTVSGAAGYFNVTAGAPTINWTRGSMVGGTNPNLLGTFTFVRTGTIASDANGLLPQATVTMSVGRSLAVAKTVRANGAADLTAANFLLADHHTLNTSAAARAVALPVGNLYPPGQEVSVSADQTGGAGANAITITPNGAETINGLNASVVCAASVKGCARLIRDPNLATNWIVLSIT